MKKILLVILILSTLLVLYFVLIPANQVLSLNEFVDLMSDYGCEVNDENETITKIKDKDSVIRDLSKILNVDESKISEHVNKRSSVEIIHPEGRQLSFDIADKINELNHEGVYLLKEGKRNGKLYQNKKLYKKHMFTKRAFLARTCRRSFGMFGRSSGRYVVGNGRRNYTAERRGETKWHLIKRCRSTLN